MDEFGKVPKIFFVTKLDDEIKLDISLESDRAKWEKVDFPPLSRPEINKIVLSRGLEIDNLSFA